MALDDLLRQLEADAGAQVAAVLAAARADAERTAAVAAAVLARRREEAMAAQDAELRAAAAGEIAAAQSEAAAEVLAARAVALDRIFARVERLAAEDDHQPAVLERVGRDLAAALRYVDGGTVRCRPELVDWARRWIGGCAEAGKACAFTVVPDATAGTGAVVSAADGALEIDATLEARLARLRPELAVLALRRLEAAP